ncbi:hypothetical protein [Changchengzhania lutea]|uniref:hypothetical protein n=1 Tax=Changchengzhania lutea TaxID=2049305 RepID=UPI00115D8476|nr:hypothetical protein [Changchengzhania lutea]
MIDNLKSKFEKYGYKVNEDNSILYFTKKNIVFKLIKQRFNEIEIYFSNSSSNNIKLDFTLEIFEDNLSIEYLISKRLGDKTENQILKYFDKLVFETGLFLVLNKKDEVEKFIKWYKNKSELVYREYLIKLKEMNFRN